MTFETGTTDTPKLYDLAIVVCEKGFQACFVNVILKDDGQKLSIKAYRVHNYIGELKQLSKTK